ncbi:MAG TPA: tRNA (adenosine(37)-N6)-dimethylallyltransferase MiaA [Patescibacteria group bacterium]|nr:tRNA (adenosine(37)-N6)-dimethylallyltransferase MiaA [Patescibacteria group bacterium]
MNKILTIAGPTATGKTSLAVKLAKEFNAEIVSADSRQVYKGMDIITGKETAERVKIWLYDVVEPNQKFSVADFYRLAWGAIQDIWKRGKLPILVGGTGFYVQAALEGIGTMGIEPNWELRERLFHCSVDLLFKTLEKLDPKRSRRMNESDRKNPRRLIRAIEIATRVQNSKLKVKSDSSKFKNLDKLLIGLTAPLQVLYRRIDERAEERVRMGAEEEIKKLLGEGYDWDNSVLGSTIGYREWRDYFEGKAARDEVIQRWKYDEHNYARRQMTWFRKTLRQVQGKWFDVDEEGWQEKVEMLVKAWYI